ncbi:MAG: lipid-A-disaccharide synthase [Candidatus Omnitrophica bacterium]|nr:lipid-A-disaccharide synthase [Candidatus Omnitrophota bacterium]
MNARAEEESIASITASVPSRKYSEYMMAKIFIITGDISGDLHGALLAKSLLEKEPLLQIFGVGGERMKAAGIKILFDLTRFSLVGFVEVARYIFLFRRVLYQLIVRIKEERPDVVIFINYPGFNLRVAEKIKDLPIPLIYYIGPQVWAWGKGRIKKIVSLFTKMITILPFEKAIYEKEGLSTSFVGHPLLDVVKPTESKEEIMKHFSLKEKCSLVTLLPGSRSCEVKRVLPVMVKLTRLIRKEKKETQFAILAASSLMEKEIEKILKLEKISLPVTKERKYELIKSSDLILTASGTATVEIAILERPMIILYKVSPLAYFFLKRIVKLPYIGMVNIIAKKEIVPEFIQRRANARGILPTALALLNQRKKGEEISSQLKEVKRALGSPGAAARAAKIILERL